MHQKYLVLLYNNINFGNRKGRGHEEEFLVQPPWAIGLNGAEAVSRQ